MARTKGFSFLFLLPLIPAGFRDAQERASFVPSQAPVSQAKYRSSHHDRVPYPTYIPRAKNSYRELEERGQAEEGQARHEYREAGTKMGFRKSLVNEIRDVLDAFDKAYLENGKCEKLREKIIKVLGFVRMALDFVN